MTWKPICAAVVLSTLMVLTAGCERLTTSKSEAVKKVASIDDSAINSMDEFRQAEESLDAWAQEESQRLQKEAQGQSDEVKAQLYQQFQLELQKKTNETLNPLKERARAAVATAAKNKGVSVVLDKKIVVYGVPDITEDVKSLLAGGGDLSYPDDEENLEKAPVGYFDQTIVRSLKVFKEAEMEVYNERNRLLSEMRDHLEKSDQRPGPAEIQQMQKTIEARLEALQEQRISPLLKAVTDSVADVAKEEGLSLVLDTQHVMYGGRNLTEQVVDSFLKRTSGGGAKPASTQDQDEE